MRRTDVLVLAAVDHLFISDPDGEYTVFCTETALTKGIVEHKFTRVEGDMQPSMYGTESTRVIPISHLDWHLSFESAKLRAEQLRKASIARLEALKF